MKKILSVLMCLTLIFSIFAFQSVPVSATQSKSNNFKKNYSLSGNGANDIVAVAKAQLEMSQSQLGYTESWCADFVSDCAKLANQSSAIPFNGVVSSLYNAVISAGGKIVSYPSAGDIAFYKTSSGSWAHVSIVSDSNKTTIHGNVSWCTSTGKDNGVWHVCTRKAGVYENAMKQTAVYVRPNYKTNVHTHNYQLAYFWAAHPHHNEYKCSCGASYVDKNSVNYYGKCTECNSFTKIKQSCYNIKNVSKGSYLNVSYGKDVNGQNVDVYNSVAYDATRFLIIPYGDAYKIHPICSSKRMLNVWGNTPSSGANVTIYDDTSHGTQLWKFKKVSNGYIIHSVYDMSLVLDASSVNSNNVVVAKYNGSNAQVWKLIVNCTHPDINTSSKTSTYFSEGYTGKKVCKTCGETISKGKTIAKKAPTVKYKAGNSKIKVAYKHVSGANGFQVVLKRGGKKYIKTFYTTKSVSKYISAKKGTYRVYTRAFNKSGKSVKYSSWTKVQYLKVK